MAISHPFGSPVLREKTPRTSHGACWNDAVFQAASERLSAGESTTLFCYCEACLLRRGDEVAQVGLELPHAPLRALDQGGQLG